RRPSRPRLTLKSRSRRSAWKRTSRQLSLTRRAGPSPRALFSCRRPLGLVFCFHEAWKDRYRWRQGRAGLDPFCRRQRVEPARIWTDRQQVKQLRRGRRHKRLSQNGDLAQNLRRHVKNRPLSLWISLCQSPGRFGCEVTVGIGYDSPDAIKHLVQLLRFHVLARGGYHGIRRRENGLVAFAECAWLRQLARTCLGDHR